MTDGVVDLRLAHERSSNDRTQEKIWDGASVGSPSIPVDGLVCRNPGQREFRNILVAMPANYVDILDSIRHDDMIRSRKN